MFPRRLRFSRFKKTYKTSSSLVLYMPRKKLKQKTEGQKLAEGFFPVDETNIKYAVEKQYKKIHQKFLETVEKP